MDLAFDLNDIKVFVAVAETGSMSAAAKQMGVPTSTVSRAVTRLEKTLAVALTKRIRLGISLTDAGREYLPSCQEALRTLEVSGQAVANWKTSPSGKLMVRCPATMAWSLIAPLMVKWSAAYPAIQVELLPFAPGRDPIPTEEADILFSLFVPENTVKGLRTYPATRRGIYASRAYVESFGEPAIPEQLAEHRCIGSREPTFAKWILKSGTQTRTLSLSFNTLAGEPVVLKQLILDGLGIGMLPVWLAKRPGVREHLIRILPDWEPVSVGLCATYATQPEPLPQVTLFLDFLAPYLGTGLDPRLQETSGEECFEALGQ